MEKPRGTGALSFVKMSRLPNGSTSTISKLPQGCSATPGSCSATPGGYSLATSCSTYSSILSVWSLTAAPGHASPLCSDKCSTLIQRYLHEQRPTGSVSPIDLETKEVDVKLLRLGFVENP